MSNQLTVRAERISSLIRTIRGEKVILDSDLAKLADPAAEQVSAP